MKDDAARRGVPRPDGTRKLRRDARDTHKEHWMLLVLFVVSFATPLLAVPDPAFRIAGGVGAAAFCFLVLRVLMVGFAGFERRVGLQIIRRNALGRTAVRWATILFVAAGVGAATLLTLRWAEDAGAVDADAFALGWTALRLSMVLLVAGASFFGLLFLIGMRSSVFATVSIFGVVVGVAALVVVQSVATGFQHEFERRVLGVYAHVNVTRNFGVPEYRRFESWLRKQPGVDGASPFVYYAMALAPWDPSGERDGDLRLASVLVKGIEPTTADQVIDLPDHLEVGSGRAIPLTDLRSDHVLRPVPDRDDMALPSVIAKTPDPRGKSWYPAAVERWDEYRRTHAVARPDEQPIGEDEWDWADPPESQGGGATDTGGKFDTSTLPTMFIGAGLARELDLGEGDVVRLVDPGATFDHSEEPKFMYYLVAGVFQAGFQEYDSRLVYVDIKELQRFKYRDRDVVSGVDLRLEDQDLAAELGGMIRGRLGNEYSVLEWHKLNENLFSSIRTQKNIITILLSLVIFVASFNVLAALWTMVVRRTPEIAIMMSMGATGPQVARIFQVTGMTIGLAGSLAGVAFGLVLCWLVQVYGYTLDPEVYFIEELPVEVSFVQIAWILGLTLSFCFVATIPPSLRAARLRPVEGLRYE